MINACCIICHDLFDGEAVVSAGPCGHTFHTECLLTWLANSATCPQCRQRTPQKSIIKLYFESSNDTEEVDLSKLKNELHALQAELKKRDSGKTSLEEENQRLTSTIKTLNKKIKDLTAKLEAERTTCDALKNQLSFLSHQTNEAKAAKKEVKQLRQKLELLQRLQQVLSENTESTVSLLSEYGDGPRAARELATYCVTLKREFETNKLARRKLKEELDQGRKKLSANSKNLVEKTRSLEQVQNQLRSTEEDLRLAIEEKQTLKSRIAQLQKTLDSPSGVSKSALTRLIMESPAPSLSSPGTTPGNRSTVHLDDSILSNPGCPDTPDLFATVQPSPSVKTKRECKEFDLPFVRTTSLAHKNKKFKVGHDPSSDAAMMSSIASSNLFTNRRPLQSTQGSLREGYNGLGGHQTFYESFRKPVAAVKVSNKKGRHFSTVTRPLPKFPTLDKYL